MIDQPTPSDMSVSPSDVLASEADVITEETTDTVQNKGEFGNDLGKLRRGIDQAGEKDDHIKETYSGNTSPPPDADTPTIESRGQHTEQDTKHKSQRNTITQLRRDGIIDFDKLAADPALKSLLDRSNSGLNSTTSKRRETTRNTGEEQAQEQKPQDTQQRHRKIDNTINSNASGSKSLAPEPKAAGMTGRQQSTFGERQTKYTPNHSRLDVTSLKQPLVLSPIMPVAEQTPTPDSKHRPAAATAELRSELSTTSHSPTTTTTTPSSRHPKRLPQSLLDTPFPAPPKTTSRPRRLPGTTPASNNPVSGKPSRVLESRIEALERSNKLLEAALMAVLKTSGTLNRCPCAILGRRNRQRDGGSGEGVGDGEGGGRGGLGRRMSAESVGSGGSGVSALDVYLETRIGTVGGLG
jgi:hypothetical protein